MFWKQQCRKPAWVRVSCVLQQWNQRRTSLSGRIAAGTAKNTLSQSLSIDLKSWRCFHWLSLSGWASLPWGREGGALGMTVAAAPLTSASQLVGRGPLFGRGAAFGLGRGFVGITSFFSLKGGVELIRCTAFHSCEEEEATWQRYQNNSSQSTW